MPLSQSIIGSGRAGIEYTLGVMTRWKQFYGAQPQIRRAALIIAGSLEDDDKRGQAARLAQFVKASLVYQQDPVNSEHITSPDVLLVAISRDGYAPGDCDDHVLLFATLAESLGIPTQIAGVKTPGSDRINHVIAVVSIDGQEIDIDLCAKHGPQPPYPEKLIVEG